MTKQLTRFHWGVQEILVIIEMNYTHNTHFYFFSFHSKSSSKPYSFFTLVAKM
jgi:hypothetical protein